MVPFAVIGDAVALSEVVNKGGVVVVLIVGILALAWVAKWLLARLLEAKDAQIKDERDEKAAWRTIALGNARTAESGLVVAEHQVGLR